MTMEPEETMKSKPETTGAEAGREKRPEDPEDVEKRIRAEVEKARREWQKAEEEKIARAKAEAEKEAAMTAEEKAIRAEIEREEKMNRREQDVARREMRLDAMEKLAKRQLPFALLDTLCYDDPEKCEASLNKVEAAFRAAVQQGVNSRMQGQTPETCGNEPDYAQMSDGDYYKMTYKKE